MDWAQFSIMIIAFVGLFTWNRSESRADYRHMDDKLEATRELIRAIHEETKSFQSTMMQESKDFHNRLCRIEETRK